jgi:hypothetical protein
MLPEPKKPHVSGRREWWEWLLLSSTMTGFVLLFIACSLIMLPEMPESTKSFLLAAFACVALLQSS